MRRRFATALCLCACADAPPAAGPPAEDPPPLGMILKQDGRVYAGAAAIDITPDFFETWQDLNGDGLFQGCPDDPDGVICVEPFDDVNGNGWFDAVWIGGFSPLRPATGVHDTVEVRAVVLAQDGAYIALVGMDLVGLGSPRIHEARDRLALDGFDADHLLAASSHNHQGPDTMGLWGNPYNLAEPLSGINEVYQERVTDAIEAAVRQAAASMEPVALRMGAVAMRDRDPYLSGRNFGGKNPTDIQHGMIFDGRDPVVVSDQLLVMQGRRPEDGRAVFTFTNWSGHPETWGSDNGLISADWVGVTQDLLDARYGGVTVHMPECLGGMQSALNGDLPLVDEAGTHITESCDAQSTLDPEDAPCFGQPEGSPRIDEDGDPVPVFAEQDSWDFVRSHGWLIAEAAIDVLEAAEEVQASPIRVEAESLYVPIENVAYRLLGPFGIFDLDLDDTTFDPTLCPAADRAADIGCIETRTFQARIGPAAFMAVPGELLPELFWGFPDADPRWADEAANPQARGTGQSAYFLQHPRACDAVDYTACRQSTGDIDGCDCKQMHAVPYRLNDDPAVRPMIEGLAPDPEVRFRATLGMTDNYLSYIVPEPDFNSAVSLLTDDGDHYEDTVSPSASFATQLQAAQARIRDRW